MGIAAAALFAAGPALAASVQPFDDTRKLCAGQTARLERLEGIPRHLLSAISVAESGRWDAARQATFAWPWTVTAEGEGRFFATKAEAVDHVRALRARDVRNIDVGCMQVNLYYHGGAFAGLEEAFDPPTNVAYAARYLKGLFDAARSWTQAAADYHSTTPERNRPYKLKVVRLWNQIRRDAAPGDQRARPVRIARPPAIDFERTAALNARLRAARAAAGTAVPGKVPGIRRDQPDAWRQVRAWRPGYARPSTARRVAADTVRTQWRTGRRAMEPAAAFTARRRAQLESWRRTMVWRRGSS